MSQTIERLVLLIVFTASFTAVGEERASTSAPAQQPNPTACAATTAIRATPPTDANADALGPDLWFVNADRSIWAHAGRWTTDAGGNKVFWIRPQGTTLTITGRRVDGSGTAPLRADVPCCYPTGFQATRVYFPAPGCWEVTAKSGQQILTFTTTVS